MRGPPLILLGAMLAAALIFVMNGPMSQAFALQATPTEISRVVSISNYGLVFIADRITFREGSSVSVGIPSTYESNLVEYYSTDDGVMVTSFSCPQHPDLIFLNVTSESPRDRVTLVTVLHGVISHDVSGFNLTFPENPVLVHEAQTFNVSILLPEDADIKTQPTGFNITTTNESVMVYTASRTLDPLARRELSVSFDSQIIHLFSVNSGEITLTFGEELNIREELSIRFEGSGERDTVKLRIPEESRVTIVKGIVDELSRTVGNESQGLVTVAVKLGQPVSNKQNVSFIIDYKAPMKTFVTMLNEKCIVHFPQSLNTTYNSYEIWMVFPSRYTLKTFEPIPQGYVKEDPYRTKVMYRLQNTALKTKNIVQLGYEEAFSISEYYSWIWAATVVIGVIGIATWVRPLAAPKPLAISPETRKIVRDMFERYDRIKKLRQRLLARPVTETMGKRGAPILRDTLRSIKRDSERISDATRKLRKAQANLGPMLLELDRMEAEIQQLVGAYSRVSDDLRRGRISKKVARRIQKEYRKQMQTHMGTEDEIIEEIRRSTE